jgi:hypothetical protein
MVGFLKIYPRTIMNASFMGDTASARLAFHAVSEIPENPFSLVKSVIQGD